MKRYFDQNLELATYFQWSEQAFAISFKAMVEITLHLEQLHICTHWAWNQNSRHNILANTEKKRQTASHKSQ